MDKQADLLIDEKHWKVNPALDKRMEGKNLYFIASYERGRGDMTLNIFAVG